MMAFQLFQAIAVVHDMGPLPRACSEVLPATIDPRLPQNALRHWLGA